MLPWSTSAASAAGEFVASMAMVASTARPSAPPTCCIVLSSAEASPASLASTPDTAVKREGHEDEAHAERDDDQWSQDVEVTARRSDARDPEHAPPPSSPDRRSAAARMPILPTKWDVTPAATMMPAVIGKKPTPVLTALQPLNVLEELGQEVEHREQRDADAEHHRETGRAISVLEDAERHERRRHGAAR